MYNVALVGNPNVGKTTIYNALTGENAKTGNWQGVTVDKRQSKIKNTDLTLVDLPGIYSLNSYSLEEKVAEEYIKGHKDSIFLNIVETANLERSINLTLSLLEKGLKVILVLTMFDEFIKYKGKINVDELSKLLRIPVIAINGQKNKDVKRLKELILASKNIKSAKQIDVEIPKLMQDIGYKGVIRKDGIDKILLNGYFTIISFVLVVFAVFSLTFSKNSLGDILASKMNYLITELTASSVKKWLTGTTCPIWLIGLIVEGFIQGIGSVLCFLPQLIILYTCITI